VPISIHAGNRWQLTLPSRLPFQPFPNAPLRRAQSDSTWHLFTRVMGIADRSETYNALSARNEMARIESEFDRKGSSNELCKSLYMTDRTVSLGPIFFCQKYIHISMEGWKACRLWDGDRPRVLAFDRRVSPRGIAAFVVSSRLIGRRAEPSIDEEPIRGKKRKKPLNGIKLSFSLSGKLRLRARERERFRCRWIIIVSGDDRKTIAEGRRVRFPPSIRRP